MITKCGNNKFLYNNISFKYPENRDNFIVKQIVLFLLMSCLLLFAYHQKELIGKIFFVLFACAVGIELFSNAKTFSIDEIIINKMFLILKKNQKVCFQEEFIEVLSNISGRNKDDFSQTSHNQLLAFNFEKTDEITTFGELNKLTFDAVFAKYRIIICVGMIIAIAIALLIIK